MILEESKYWDESEFGFFETLEDTDKLLYLYDLLIGEIAYIDIHNDSVDADDEMHELDSLMNQAYDEMGFGDDEDDSHNEGDSDIWDYENDKHQVVVAFKTDGELEKLQMKGQTLDVLLKVSSDMMMNGMILMDRDIQFDKYEPWGVTLTYTLVGNVPPISVN